MSRQKDWPWYLGLFCLTISLFVVGIFLVKTHATHSSSLPLTIFNSHTFAITLLLLGGFIGGKIIKIFKMPAVTGYVLIGIIMGLSFLNIIGLEMTMELEFIKVAGLSVIALIIGGDLQFSKLRAIGLSVINITIVEVIADFVFVTFATRFFLGYAWPTAMILGAISSATAPAATVAVVHEYKAHGPLTDTLIAIVAFDDAVCLILFSVVTALVGLMTGASQSFSFVHLLEPLWEILGSFLLGSMIGFITIFFLRWVKEKHEVVVLVLGVALLGSELAGVWQLSPLLVNMTFGVVLTNFSQSPLLFRFLDDIELPIFIAFFTLAGTELNIKILALNWVGALVYIFSRAMGKLGGVYLGGIVAGVDKKLKKYLGFAMLPQAGVAIALVLQVSVIFPHIASLITALVLGSVAVNEIMGPIGSKYAITKAGEAGKASP
ncbi:MAG: cation:proton antiporter [bacterium]